MIDLILSIVNTIIGLIKAFISSGMLENFG